MKILFICHRFPYPPNRGGKIRPFNMISHLGKSHSVVVATLAHNAQELQEGAPLTQYCDEVIAEVVPERARWIQAVGALVTATPSSAAYFKSAQLGHRVRAAWKRYAFDAIWVHCAFVAHYAVDLPAKRRVLDYGDLDSGKWSDYSHYRAFPLSAGYALETYKMRARERSLASQFHHCTVTAPGELEELRRLGIKGPCTVIPNGVDLNYFQLQKRTKSEHPVLVFLGRMDYFPNVDGIIYFAKQIFPLIRQRFPNVELRVIGSNPTRAVRKLADIPGITITGYVPDVRPLMEDATVSVVPLNISRGTQNKMLECMAMGVPMVATSKAAKGTQGIAGKHFMVADDPVCFAKEVLRLVSDAGLRERVAGSARDQVEQKHLWRASMELVDAVIALETSSTIGGVGQEFAAQGAEDRA